MECEVIIRLRGTGFARASRIEAVNGRLACRWSAHEYREPSLALLAIVSTTGFLPIDTLKEGMLPLMKESNVEVAMTESSQVPQLLINPAGFSMDTGVVVRVQGPVL
jgi:hypothetical protein